MPGFSEMSKHDSSFDEEMCQPRFSFNNLVEKRMRKKLDEDYNNLMMLYQQCHAERHPLQLKLAKATKACRKYGLVRLTDGIDTLYVEVVLLSRFMNIYNRDGSVNFDPYSLRIKNYVLVLDCYLSLLAYYDISKHIYTVNLLVKM